MKFSAQDHLIHEADTPQGLLYRLVLIYIFSLMLVISALTLMFGNLERVNFYAFINVSTVIIIAWFIRRSFKFASGGQEMALLRLGLFLMMNSSLISLASGLSILARDLASLIAAVFYAPAMLLIVISFNKFLSYADNKYTHAVNLSLTDELTGLPNRRHMNIKLKQMESRSGIICIADIDHFKKINDNYGHEKGDKVLKMLGSHLQKFLSDDVFIARSGGEEFSFLFFDRMEVSREIVNIKESLLLLKNAEVHITLSIGVAVKGGNRSVTRALSAADEALYKAKNAGRDRIVYSPIKL